jgi:hypothetical protein
MGFYPLTKTRSYREVVELQRPIVPELKLLAIEKRILPGWNRNQVNWNGVVVAKWLDTTVFQIVRTRAVTAARLFDVNRQSAIRLTKLALPQKNKRTVSNEISNEELNDRLAKVYADLGWTDQRANSEPSA